MGFVEEYLKDNGYNADSYESAAAAEEIANAMNYIKAEVMTSLLERGKSKKYGLIEDYLQDYGYVGEINEDNYASADEIRKAMRKFIYYIHSKLQNI